jgi:trk system potassium uptake protein TrkA
VRVLILGCGRLTQSLVPSLAQAGHQVTVLSGERDCLETVAENPEVDVLFVPAPTLQDYLRQGGVDRSNVFLALSEDDHLNALCSQIAKHIFGVRKVVCLLERPHLQLLYSSLGIDVVGYFIGLTQDIQQAIEG